MRPTLAALAILTLLLGGCSRQPQPILASGKPTSYWLGQLQDREARVRRSAVNNLGSIGRADAAVLPALVNALKDPDPTVRSAAILALVKCNPVASEAIPMLTEMQQKDGSAQVRSYAARALEQLQDRR